MDAVWDFDAEAGTGFVSALHSIARVHPETPSPSRESWREGEKAQLLERLGSISPARVRLRPPPGTATPQEMERKLREYFEAGVKLVWYVYPQTRTVRVYTAPERMLELGEDQTLEGGDVLPGFSAQIRDWFRRAE